MDKGNLFSVVLHFIAVIVSVCAVVLLALGCRTKETTYDIPSVDGFDIIRYQGKWHEIARLPNSYQRYMFNSGAIYTLQKNGTMKVENYGYTGIDLKKIEGIAKLKENSSRGELKVSFFRPFYGDYRVIHLEPDYSAAIITGRTRDLLWILARNRKLDEKKKQEYLRMLRSWGYNTDRLIFSQKTEDGK